MSTTLNGKINQIIVFTLHDQEFGVEITEVKEIIKMTRIVRLPNEMDFFEGIINLRGSVTPIINLRKKFFMPETNSDQNRIIIAEFDENQVGFIVDSVAEVLKINNENIHPVQGRMDDAEEYVVGIAKIDQRILLIINLYSLLSSSDIVDMQDMVSGDDSFDDILFE